MEHHIMGIFGFEQTSNGSGPVEMFRGEVDASGDPIFTTTERTAYIVPAKGVYRLKVTGFSKPWDEEKKKEYQKEGQNPMTTKTHLELEIADGRGKGKRFLWSFQTFSLSSGDNPANLARIYEAGVLKGDRIKRGQKVFFEEMFGQEFEAYVNVSDTVDEQGRPRYATLARETIKAVAAEGEEYDPFADTEDVA
jgi:hypothetical protein